MQMSKQKSEKPGGFRVHPNGEIELLSERETWDIVVRTINAAVARGLGGLRMFRIDGYVRDKLEEIADPAGLDITRDVSTSDKIIKINHLRVYKPWLEVAPSAQSISKSRSARLCASSWLLPATIGASCG
jgi:hypothetical protein